MLKLLKYFLWILVILALTVSFDQLMVQLPLHSPGLKQTQQFYVDFRIRLIGLFGKNPDPQPDAIETVIKKTTTATLQSATKSKRYLYVDDSGALQFADSLQQVPKQYRKEAQPLAE